MAYQLHIERPDSIPFSEFAEVVEGIPELKLTISDIVGVNPRTHEKIRIKSEGAVQVFDEEDQVWLRIFEFNNGKISWKAPLNWEEWYLKHLALQLAEKLNGRIVGDEGEGYQ